jgi:hypothetical protein
MLKHGHDFHDIFPSHLSSRNAFCRSGRLLDEPVCHNKGGLFGRKYLPGQFGRKPHGLMGDNYLVIIARKMRSRTGLLANRRLGWLVVLSLFVF